MVEDSLQPPQTPQRPQPLLNKVVEDILSKLSLNKCADTVVGGEKASSGLIVLGFGFRV